MTSLKQVCQIEINTKQDRKYVFDLTNAYHNYVQRSIIVETRCRPVWSHIVSLNDEKVKNFDLINYSRHLSGAARAVVVPLSSVQR